MVMKQKFKLIFYGVGALILLPQSIHAQFVKYGGVGLFTPVGIGERGGT